MDLIEITWGSSSIDEARKVSRYLVQERYVAEAKIVPWIESITLLNNQLETDQETLVILKTTIEHLNRVIEVIQKNSKMQVPEIVWRGFEGGNQEYMDWLENSTKLARA